MCKQNKGKIQHVISRCLVLAPTRYIGSHNNVCKYIHICLPKKYKFLENVPKWYSYGPERLLKNDPAKILWNTPGQSDRRINYNKPDILVTDALIITNPISS